MPDEDDLPGRQGPRARLPRLRLPGHLLSAPGPSPPGGCPDTASRSIPRRHRLTAQYGEEKGTALYEAAKRETLHYMRIDNLRCEVHTAIREIRQEALKAEAAIARMESDEVYDVETAESVDMEYLKSFLQDIRKAGIAAFSILPFDEHGDPK